MRPSGPTSRGLALISLVAALGGVADAVAAQNTARGLAPEALQGLRWRHIGPAISSGRIADIDVDRRDPHVIYLATASGGAWKTLNNGTTWEPIFDAGNTGSLGAIAVSPSHPNIVWIGTGEANSVRSSSYGDGVYRSENGGKSWRHMGLEPTRHVGRILIDPDDPDIVYVAGLGSLWGPNEERGLFKTADGGATWERILYVSEHTGVVDVAMDPRNPEVLYASSFQRERRMWSMLGGGPEAGIFKSRDGGRSWEELGHGLPAGNMGRIGLSICADRPDTLYAAIVAPDGGIFRSDDAGASWERRNADVQSHWYYGQIYCDPSETERLYVPMTRFHVSEDGGRTFSTDLARRRVHGDHHTLWINPADPDHLVLGNDGGVYISYDRGLSWQFQGNVPVTQFYTVAVDMQEPFYTVYGGTQDNQTWGGPSGTRYSDGIANEDWYVTTGGDGFYTQIDPTDPSIVYSESQYGVLSRFDTRTGERRRIQPWQPQDGSPAYRWNWSAPLQISPHDPATLYFVANVLFKSTDRGNSWSVISPDLSRGIDRAELPLQGVVQPPDAIDLHASTALYGNISTLSVSPLRAGQVAVGTDDGLIQVTRDDGGSWQRSDRFPGVPEMVKVSWVSWSAHAEGKLYATFDAHKDNLLGPFVVKSDDHGATWVDITGNLPELGSSRVIAEHPANAELLFVGTETGVFVSLSGGGDWMPLRDNLPTVPVHGLLVHPRANDLVIGTHGRGFWIIDDISILDELTLEARASGLHLARTRPAYQLHEFNRGRGAQGDSFFAAENPPRGAIISYWLASKADSVVIEILDGDGSTLRRLPIGDSGPGIHRVVWDLRHPSPYEVDQGQAPRGHFVLPGRYRVRLSVDGEQRTVPVEVRGDPAIEIDAVDRRRLHDILTRQSEMVGVSSAALTTARELAERLAAARRALEEMPTAAAELLSDTGALAEDVRGLLVRLRGPGQGGIAQQEAGLPLDTLVRRLYSTTEAWTGLPTADQEHLTGWAQGELQDVVDRLNELAGPRFSELGRRLQATGVRWSPGRPIGLP